VTKTFNADVLIIGAGLVGSAQALALAKYGISSLIVDKALPDEVMRAGYDGRVSAISHASVQVLQHLDVWKDVVAEAGAIDSIFITEGGKHSDILFDAEEIGGDPFGYMVPNQLLRKTLLQRVLETPQITYQGGETITALNRSHAVEATLESGATVAARLLLVADGRYSSVREMVGIHARKFDYDQQAIVCIIAHAKPHHNQAVEWFFPEGPLAILPMQGGHTSAIVWTEETAMANHLVSLDADDFHEELRLKLAGKMGVFTLEGKRYCYPLNLFQAETYIADRCIIIGDAAHAIHPIAGQGVNLGYRDVAVLTELLVEATRAGQDIGSAALLAHYQQWRRFDATSMTAATDILNRLFSSDSRTLRHLRRAGMAVFNRTDILKSFFMHAAMGMEGDIPKMLAGERL
jgi:2-octaprenyl-6-methoxyphenol hydroxylase